MIIQRDAELISVDARPSDSIAIALRMAAAIYTTDDLLEHTSIEVTDASEHDFVTETEEEKGSPGGLTPEQLREYLRRMNPEDFGRFNP
jgi:bifunctional DNase/RNase